MPELNIWSVPDEYPNSEHINMIGAVIRAASPTTDIPEVGQEYLEAVQVLVKTFHDMIADQMGVA